MLRILIRDFMRGYSDKDIASATEKLEDDSVRQGDFIEVTWKEYKAVAGENLRYQLFVPNGLRIKD